MEAGTGVGNSQPVLTGSPHVVVEEAFKNFEKLIRPGDDRMFKQTSLKDVEQAARIISRDQSQRKCLRNLNRIKPLFDVLHKLSAPIETLCQGTPYLCYIWAPIKLMLQIADEYNNSFEKLVDAYEQIARHLPRLDRLSDTFSNQTEFQSVVADIYSDILDFHSHAYKLLRRGGWKTLFDASWRSFSARFSTILCRLERGRDLLDKEAASFEILESKIFRQKMLEDLEKQESQKREWQMRDALLWLDLKGQDREQEELIERRVSSREPTTCIWLLNHPKISKWLSDEESHTFLWLSGKPGSGKTTLATYLIEEAAFPPKSMVLFCLCSYGFGQSEGNAHSLAIRALIGQVVRFRSDLLPHMYDNYVKVGIVNSLPKTRVLLRELLQTVELTYLIIDGIDECRSDHQKHILAELSSLANQRDDSGTIKVLVCSRETPEIVRKLAKVPRLSLNDVKESVQHDIRAFTMASLADLQGQFDQAVVADVGDRIVEKANGMFLWVQLVVASVLEQASVEDLRRTVSHLPTDLHAVYQSILNNIIRRSGKQQQDRIRFILGLLALSCRPLRAWEICDFVTFYEGATALNDQNKLTKIALIACKPLIEELHGENIHIVHFSAREFFFERASGPFLDEIHVQRGITAVCVKYLLTCGIFLSLTLDPKILAHVVRGFHDLFPYVHEFWTIHLAKAFPEPQKLSVEDGSVRHLLLLLNTLAVFMNPYARSAPANVHNPDSIEPVPAIVRHESHLPQTIVQYVAYRRRVAEKQSQMITDPNIGLDSASEDPSVLSRAYKGFMTAFESLLGEDYPQHIDPHLSQVQIEGFRSRHFDSAYLCRWIGCVWASSGFKSVGDRETHEERHRKRFCCPHPECDEASGRFASKQSLRKHQERYHTTVANTLLPQFPASGSKTKDNLQAVSRQQWQQAQQKVGAQSYPRQSLSEEVKDTSVQDELPGVNTVIDNNILQLTDQLSTDFDLAHPLFIGGVDRDVLQHALTSVVEAVKQIEVPRRKGSLGNRRPGHRKIAASFLSLPSRRESPGYYKSIQRPISIDMIDARIERHQYSSLLELQLDIKLLVVNAMTYWKSHSWIQSDALMIETKCDELIAEQLSAHPRPPYSPAPVPGRAAASSSDNQPQAHDLADGPTLGPLEIDKYLAQMVAEQSRVNAQRQQGQYPNLRRTQTPTSPTRLARDVSDSRTRKIPGFPFTTPLPFNPESPQFHNLDSPLPLNPYLYPPSSPSLHRSSAAERASSDMHLPESIPDSWFVTYDEAVTYNEANGDASLSQAQQVPSKLLRQPEPFAHPTLISRPSTEMTEPVTRPVKRSNVFNILNDERE